MRKTFPEGHIISKQNNIFSHSDDYGILLLILQVYTKTSILLVSQIIQVLPIDFSRARAESEV